VQVRRRPSGGPSAARQAPSQAHHSSPTMPTRRVPAPDLARETRRGERDEDEEDKKQGNRRERREARKPHVGSRTKGQLKWRSTWTVRAARPPT
jgi:hypothetical protein